MDYVEGISRSSLSSFWLLEERASSIIKVSEMNFISVIDIMGRTKLQSGGRQC